MPKDVTKPKRKYTKPTRLTEGNEDQRIDNLEAQIRDQSKVIDTLVRYLCERHQIKPQRLLSW